jgi:hypothetical protein
MATKTRPRRRPPMYRADLPLAWIEKLAQGICTEGLAVWAHGALRWRREAIRATMKARRPRGRRR